MHMLSLEDQNIFAIVKLEPGIFLFKSLQTIINYQNCSLDHTTQYAIIVAANARWRKIACLVCSMARKEKTSVKIN